jgi:aspartate/methionine/tyrosine aminotransferase
MSNEMRLARIDYGPGWIDLGYGEPVVVAKVLNEFIQKTGYMLFLPDPKDMMKSAVYQPPQGYTPLVKLLEEKYGAKVVITNGAKHGLAAVFSTLRGMGHQGTMIHSPYWTSTPSLIENAGLQVQYMDQETNPNVTSFVVTSPNNPDGRELTKKQLIKLTKDAKDDDVILVHDAAYYTPIYMEKPKSTTKVGDVQVYSFSKMWGMSGLRIGYVVVHNEKLLPGIIEYVEQSCSGVSTASQQLAYTVENYFMKEDKNRREFEKRAREAIARSRKELKNINPEVLQVEPCQSNSMFAWCKVGPKLDYKAAKVNLMPGDIFGRVGYVRINLAVDSDLIKTAVERLNDAQKDTKEST